MSDLISRQAAIDALLKADCGCGIDSADVIRKVPSAKEEIESAYAEGYTNAESKYREYLPKTGEWIDTGSGQECSVCREVQYGYDNYRNFCPYCGADMRGAKK